MKSPDHRGASPQPATRRPADPKPPAGHGATSGVDLGGFDAYWNHHRQVARESWLRLVRTPVASFLTWAVIAIALALPASLFALLANIEELSQNWTGNPSITLYLDLKVRDNEALRVQQTLENKPQVAAVVYVSPKQALEQFQEQSGLGDAIGFLDENPLPPVLIVTPSADIASAAELQRLVVDLQALQQVERVQLDMDWVKRLYSFLDLVERAIFALGIMLAVAVLLVIGNTIRLAIENRREEIVVVKLVGGTDAFVRRPFLYTGVWYGLGGGVLAWLLVFMWLLWLSSPVEELAKLYFFEFELSGLGFEATLVLLMVSMLLGWAGAWIAVRRHLDAIEPQ